MSKQATRWSDEHPFLVMLIALVIVAAVSALITAGDATDGSAGSTLRVLGVVLAFAGIALLLRISERARDVANAIREARRRA